MRPELLVLLSGALTFGVPLLIAVRELKVTGPGSGWRPERLPDPEMPRKPLPPCLIPPSRRPRAPEPAAPRQRILEPV
jgi:hypothetical protein